MIDCHYVRSDHLAKFSMLKEMLLFRLDKACVECILQCFQFRKISLYLLFNKLLSNQVITSLLPQAVHLLDSSVTLL